MDKSVLVAIVMFFLLVSYLYLYFYLRKTTKKEKRHHKNFLFWAPRIFTIIFILFLSLFALDGFIEDSTFWKMIGAFLIHLFPTYILIIVALIAWKWEHIGGIIFIFLGFANVLLAGFRVDLLACLLVSGPLFLAGGLFLLNYYTQKSMRNSKPCS